MSIHDDFMADPAFLRAVQAASDGMSLCANGAATPEASARIVAAMVLVAFANADGLTEPHVGILARFAPNMGGTASDAAL